MSIEKIEKGKARTDIFIFIFFLVWIILRVLNYLNIEGMEIAFHFTRLIIAIGAIFLIIQYVYFSKILTDELDADNKSKAHKFSWIFMMLSAILLYILCRKTSLNAEFAIELILWIGYLSYFLSYKFLDKELHTKISEKSKKLIIRISIFITTFIFGMNLGFTMPKMNSIILEKYKVLYISISVIILITATIYLLKFVKKLKEEENGTKRRSQN
ncbi:MAG: hypothetical protein H8E57_05980 [Candidatus Cloacimonetes bacterium]|nr:hypothetical protein [Candidatus Cloacimonadota bacterium]